MQECEYMTICLMYNNVIQTQGICCMSCPLFLLPFPLPHLQVILTAGTCSHIQPMLRLMQTGLDPKVGGCKLTQVRSHPPVYRDTWNIRLGLPEKQDRIAHLKGTQHSPEDELGNTMWQYYRYICFIHIQIKGVTIVEL